METHTIRTRLNRAAARYGVFLAFLLGACSDSEVDASDANRGVAALRVISGPARVDLGDRNGAARLVHEFEIGNPTGLPLSVERLVPSCTCSAVQITTRHLDPGQTARLELSANVEGRRGEFEADVHIVVGTGPNSGVLKVSLRAWLGDSIRLEFVPPRLVWGPSEARVTKRARLVLAGDAGRAPVPELSLVEAEFFEARFGANSATDPLTGHREMEVLIEPRRAARPPRNGVVSAETRMDGIRLADRLALHMESSSPAGPQPERLWLGVVAPGAMFEVQLPVRAPEADWTLMETVETRRASAQFLAERNGLSLQAPSVSGRFEIPIRLRQGDGEHELTLVGFGSANSPRQHVVPIEAGR